MAGTSPRRSYLRFPLLLALESLEERPQLPSPKPREPALDQLEEQRGPVAERLGEDLEQIALVVAVDEDAEPAEVREVLLDLPDPVGYLVVVGPGDRQEVHAAPPELRDGLDDVSRGQRHVLYAGALVVAEVLLDLRLAACPPPAR